MMRVGIGLILTALLFGALPTSAGHCASQQTALRTPQCCCTPSVHEACAMACTRESGDQQPDLRAATTETTLKTVSDPLAYQHLSAPAIHLAAADSPTATSPASVPRRYLLTCTLRL